MNFDGLALLQIAQYAAPVAIAAIGETLGQKAGVINIGLEGSMLVGAFVATLVAIATHSALLGILAGVGAGLLVTCISGAFAISLHSDQVVVGTAVNLLALGATGTVYRSTFGKSGQLVSLPALPKWHGLDVVIVVAVLAAPCVGWALSRTAWGLALRSVGEYPKSAEAAGLSVAGLRYSAVLVAGVFAGLAGAYLSVGLAGSFAEGMTVGRGFVAIAMVTFGRWRPTWAALAAVAIGFVDLLQFRFQAMGWKAPFQLALALPYLVALLVLIFVGKGAAAPEALGAPHRRDK